MRKTTASRARGKKTAVKAMVVPAKALYRAMVKVGGVLTGLRCVPVTFLESRLNGLQFNARTIEIFARRYRNREHDGKKTKGKNFAWVRGCENFLHWSKSDAPCDRRIMLH